MDTNESEEMICNLAACQTIEGLEIGRRLGVSSVIAVRIIKLTTYNNGRPGLALVGVHVSKCVPISWCVQCLVSTPGRDGLLHGRSLKWSQCL